MNQSDGKKQAIETPNRLQRRGVRSGDNDGGCSQMNRMEIMENEMKQKKTLFRLLWPDLLIAKQFQQPVMESKLISMEISMKVT